MTKFCPSCGEKHLDSAKFCKNCGAKLDNPTYVQQRVNAPLSENNHTFAIVAGYICAFLLPIVGIIFGIYLLTRNDSPNANMHGKIIIGAACVVWIVSFAHIIGF